MTGNGSFWDLKNNSKIGQLGTQLADKPMQLDLDFANGIFSSGAINYSGNIGICSENYIPLTQDLIIVLKNADCKFRLAYYTSANVFTGTYSSYYTTSQIIPAQASKNVRIMVTYADDRTFSTLYPLKGYVEAYAYKTAIPSYWTSHVESKITAINNLQKASGFNCASFAFITDMHIKDNAKISPYLMQKVMNDCDIPYYFDGGDFTTGAANTTKLTQIADIDYVKCLYKPLESRCLRAVGNHDENSIDDSYAKTITDKEMYNLLYRKYSKYQHYKSGDTGEYFYVDDEMHKLRYIVINSCDIPYVNPSGDLLQYSSMDQGAFRKPQIDWFADIALAVPNDKWGVVVCSHHPINTGAIRNDSIVMNILQAFKDKTSYTTVASVTTDFEVPSRTVNYTGKGGSVVCWIAGHTHLDGYVTVPGGITYKVLTTLNDSLAVESGAPTKTVGTTTEQAFDVFTINTSTKAVNITRIGAGSDRSFTY